MNYMDKDILQVKTFSAGATSMEEAMSKADEQVNGYLRYDADLVHSIQPIVTVLVLDGVPWYRYTVMVSLRS